MTGQSAAEQHVGQAPGDLARLQAFVNTLDIEQGTEELGSPQALAHWLEAAGLMHSPAAAGSSAAPTAGETAPTAADLAMALELREALRGVLQSHVARPAGNAARGPSAPEYSTPEDSTPEDSTPEDSAGQLAGLRRISARLPTRLDVTTDGRIGLAAAGTGVPAALARILLIAADSATLGTWPRLKVCSADDCRWAFYDRSPARSGCWCSMRLCGARAKSRAYRKRTAAPPASSPPR